MPSIRRRAQRQRRTLDSLTSAERIHLTSSWRGVGRMFQTIEEFTEAWDAVRDEVMERWIEKNPGSRPFAWWRVDHGNERPIVEQLDWMTPERLDGERNNSRHWQTFGYLHNATYLEEQENYLRRNGLLLPGEEERIAEKRSRQHRKTLLASNVAAGTQ